MGFPNGFKKMFEYFGSQ